MRLQRLKLRNFKGCRSFDLILNGEDASIYGDNGTFKTTLMDGFQWLLFDKDSANRKDFDIKTLDENGEPIHGLDHEVEAALRLNGKELTLRKVYREKWTKKRGSATKEFTGHTTDYFIDGVPAKKGEYDKLIADIASEDIFKLLTSPSYFNEQLHWQERRSILLEVCGDISDEDVIAADKKLSKLSEILSNRSLGDHRKVIQARRSEINKELEKIPVRINEAELAMPDISNIKPEALPKDMATLKEMLQEKNQELARLEAGGEMAEKTKLLRESEAEILQLQSQSRSKNDDKIQELRKQLNESQERCMALNMDAKRLELNNESHSKMVTELTLKAGALRDQWHEEDKRQFEQDDTCPTCGQELPEKMREEALSSFNREKAKRLEAISAEGKECMEKAKALKAEMGKAGQKIASLQDKVKKEHSVQEELSRQIKKLEQEAVNQKDDPAVSIKLKVKAAMEKEIESLKAGHAEAREKIVTDIQDLDIAISTLEECQAKVRLHEQLKKRINELQQQERDLAAEYERLEQELYLTEQFIRTKVTLLEEKINSKFRLARFKLFNVLVNGAVDETCETLYNGVPYSSGLNDGHRGIVGLDIIDTLADHYDFHPPIFYDNAESVTQLPEMKSQMICLYVSEPDKELRVETQKELAKEAV